MNVRTQKSRQVAGDIVIQLAEIKAVADARIGAKLARIGLTLDDVRLLNVLDHGAVERAALAREMHLSVSAAVRAIRPLEKLGWVQRADDGDFSLTKSGVRLVTEARRIVDDEAKVWLPEHELEHGSIARLRAALHGSGGHR